MSTQTFNLTFKGEAVNNGTINLNDLVPVLMSINELCKKANCIINNNNTNFNLNVQSFEKGSFKINLEAIVSTIDNIKQLFEVCRIYDVKDILETLGFTGEGTYSLIKLIKVIKNRKIENKIIEQDNNITITTVDKQQITINKNVYNLYINPDIRKNITEIVKPLKNNGIDNIIFEEETIDKTEIDYFEMPNFIDNIIQEQTITAVYSIISLSFKEDNKWRVSDGNNIFNVVIKDDNFIKNIINNSIAFSKDDILKCDVKITSYSTINGLKTDYEIIKVLEHKKAYRQLDLFN